MTKATAAELLDLLIDRAPKLRSAGYSKVALDGMSFELRAPEPEVQPSGNAHNDEDDDRRDALHDPDTFGGRRVPGNQRRERLT